MHKLAVKTHRKREVLDITEEVNRLLEKSYAGKSGVCHLSILHTTAALTTADLDPGTDLDMLDAFEAMIPKLATVTRTIRRTCPTTSFPR